MNMSKITRVAGREFASTAMTKGFIIGALVVPALLAVLMPVVIMLAMSVQPPADTGTVYVLDRSGDVSGELAQRLSPEEVEQRWRERFDEIREVSKNLIPGQSAEQTDAGFAAAKSIIKFPEFRVIPTAPDADIEEIKAELRAQVASKIEQSEDIETLLAVVEIDADATRKINQDEGFGAYQVFFRPKLNEETVGEIKNSIRWAIREKRYENAGIDRTQIHELDSIEARKSQEITEEGERDEASEIASFAIPFVSMLLLLIASMTGGQYLLTTTIEEKSNRVVEVLLSACSPMELMTGKILGQMAVGLSLLLIYNSLGIFALVMLKRGDLIEPSTIGLIFVYFILAYFMFASLMAAIGSAVNDLREAQSLMTPVIMMMMLPYIFFMPVIRAPNSMLATVSGFIPPISPFIMIMRVASTDPPPAWQVAVSIAINMVAVVFFLWLAAKVFRVGLLMFGKPPNLRTLIKWVRMA
jgi:ABC-2 type transport system permease protein